MTCATEKYCINCSRRCKSCSVTCVGRAMPFFLKCAALPKCNSARISVLCSFQNNTRWFVNVNDVSEKDMSCVIIFIVFFWETSDCAAAGVDYGLPDGRWRRVAGVHLL